MAGSILLIPTSLALLSLVVIASPDHGYVPKPDTHHDDKPMLDDHRDMVAKSDVSKPNSEDNYGYHGNKPDIGKPSSSSSEIKEKPLPLGIEGVILCKLGSKYQSIRGAVARVTCLAEDEQGYEAAPFSVLSCPTNDKGYFLATLYPSQIDSHLKLTECKAFLEDSPLETCKVPTDVNKGISGALLSSYRILNDKKMKLYSVGPFFYTSEPAPATSVPNGY